MPLSSVTSIIDGLKRLYIQKLKPLEVTYRFNDFVSPLLVSEQWFQFDFLPRKFIPLVFGVVLYLRMCECLVNGIIRALV